MKPNKLTILAIGASLLLCGCDESSYHHHAKNHLEKPAKETVKCYKVRNNTDDSWLWWYLIYDSNTRDYYYSYSSSPITSSGYSSLNWQTSKTQPKETENKEEVSEEQVPDENLGTAETEINSDYSSIPEENSLDSMEGNNTENESPGESSESSDSGSDSGSSGGDSGGGDGGGGGE